MTADSQALERPVESDRARTQAAARAAYEDELGARLAFVLGTWRSGTTLLRKVLDSHPRLYSPAETWFLLPLLNLWQGGAADRQASAALRGHLNSDQFLSCCRAFAARFYRLTRPTHAAWYIDKTPFYIQLADVLPRLFPRALFMVITRDPRGTVWSRHTWKHIRSTSPESHFEEVARDNQKLAAFLRENPTRSLHVSYETLCCQPDDAAQALCRFLSVPFDPAMVAYGRRPHHEGFGCEKTREHDRPHVEALTRWDGPAGLPPDQQARLAALCGAETLRQLGYADLAQLAAQAAPA